jgi:hypothetical protein
MPSHALPAGRTSSRFSYSIDGENFITDGLDSTEFYVSLYYGLVELDFSGMEGVDDNPDFKVRLTLAGENSGPENTSGNQRINHVTMEGSNWSRMSAGALSTTGILTTFPTMWISRPILRSVPGASWADRVPLVAPGCAMTVPAGTASTIPRRSTPVHEPYDIEDDRALRMRNPAGDFIVRIPYDGHKNVVVRYAAKRTDSGSELQRIAWSTDGSRIPHRRPRL